VSSRFLVDSCALARQNVPPPPLTDEARNALITTLQSDIAIAEYRADEAQEKLAGLRKRLDDLLDI